MRVLLVLLFAAVIAIGWRGGGPPSVKAAAPPTQASASWQPRESKGTIQLARNPEGHFTVAGDVAGVGLTFVVDTGATSVALTREDAARVGLHITDADFTGEARTASGTVRVAHATLPRVRIGDIQLLDVPAMVLDAPDVMPLLGQSFLSRLDQVTIAHDMMTLTKG